MAPKNNYRVNWGNGQVQAVSSKNEGVKMMKGDLYERFAFVQKYAGFGEWQTVARGNGR